MGWEILVVPYILAGLGGLLTEKSGPLNIALEGAMGLGAFAAAVVVLATGQWILTLPAALAVGLAAGYLQGLVRERTRSDPFIVGLSFNLLLPALTVILSQLWFGTKGTLQLPPAGDRGLLTTGLLWVSLGLVGLTWYLLARTPWGLRLRAAGLAPAYLRSRGVRPESYQLLALVLSGGLSALAGAQLVLRLGAYLSGLTAGRGWIALVALYLGARHPLGLVLAAVLFAGAEVGSQHLAGLHLLPEGVILALPYLITLGALVVYSGIQSWGKGRVH